MTLLVLGLGNAVLSDEGMGVRLVERLRADPPDIADVEYVDGGTIGLALLPLMEDADGILVLDAALMRKEPGSVGLYEGLEMDRFLRTRGRSPHDVGLDDLMDALRLRDRLPERRALVGVEPEKLTIGCDLTPKVEAALPRAVEICREVLVRWRQT